MLAEGVACSSFPGPIAYPVNARWWNSARWMRSGRQFVNSWDALRKDAESAAPYRVLPDVVRGVTAVVVERLRLFNCNE